jgi:hypothetical protein
MTARIRDGDRAAVGKPALEKNLAQEILGKRLIADEPK